MWARSVQLSAAAALGRLAGFSDDLAAEVVRLGILPHLVRPPTPLADNVLSVKARLGLG